MVEKFEKWVIKVKQKLGTKVISVTMFCIFGMVILILMNYINVYGRNKGNINDIYNKTMYEIVTDVNNLNNLVTKLRITKGNEYNIITLSKILSEANRAKNNLSTLPINQNSMQPVSKFLSQVIGYSQTLISKLSKEETLNAKEYENIEKINDVSDKLNNILSKIYNKLNDGTLRWDEVEKVATKELDENEIKLDSISSVKKAMETYEGLIYDGAFSNHLESVKPKNLTGDDVSVKEATKKAYDIVVNTSNKCQIDSIIYNGEIDGKIKVYSFTVTLKEKDYSYDLQITKKDGKLLLLMSDRKVQKDSIKIKDTKEIGDNYLKKLGLSEFKPTYYMIENNMATINYAAVQNKVVLYPDLIKVKIAMDTGEILSVECTGYIYNHTERENVTASITKEEAIKNISKGVEAKYSTLCIIPKESGKEVLTYEFRGKANGKDFLIYINASDGKEENVLLVIDNKNGTFTI